MADKFYILALIDGPGTAYERLASTKELARMGKRPCPENYTIMWEDILPRYTSISGLLESLITRFAWSPPKGYGRPVTVSDIIAISENDGHRARFFYVDPVGFEELLSFRFDLGRGEVNAPGSE